MKSICSSLCAVALLAATSASAGPVDLTGLVNSDLIAGGYANGFMYPPSGGALNVGGIGFQLATLGNGDTGIIGGLNPITLVNIPVGQSRIGTVYTLINSAFGAPGTVIGQLDFNFTGGSVFSYSLIEALNVRDHFQGGFVNTAPAVAATALFGDGSVRFDMQAIVIPLALSSLTLESVDFRGFGQGVGGEPMLAAITAEALPTPLPGALLLFASGAGLLGLLGQRRKRKARAGV
jgi:hypothetical protein